MMTYEGAKRNLIKGVNIPETEAFLKRAASLYTNNDTVILTDAQYDELYRLYNNLTGKEIIGAAPPTGSKTVSVKHNYENLVGTLEKAPTLNDISDFLKRIKNVKNMAKYNIRLSLKFDGNSVTIEYDEDGNPLKALTRGQDGLGKDIIDIFKDSKIDVSNNFNLSLLDSPFAIKYEVVLTYDDYEKLAAAGDSKANPRSAISGLLGRKEAINYKDYMTLIPLEMRVESEGFAFENNKKKLYTEEINEAYPNNYFDQYQKTLCCNNLNEVKNEIKKYYNEVNDMRLSLPFMIDGIVVEFLDKEIINQYFYDPKGYTPKHSIAVKLPYLEEITEVKKVDFCVGNSGRITPRIWFKPVEFNGTVHKKQQISNYKRFKDLNLGVGSKILVTYRNDCLSYITKVEDQPKGIIPFKFIEKCPICKGKITIRTNDDGEQTIASCDNPKCEGRNKGKIENFFVKMKIKGIKMNTIDDLYDDGILRTIEDIFSLDQEAMTASIGPKNAQNILESINNKFSDMFDYELIGALGIENIGVETAKAIFKAYNFEEVIDAYNDETLKTKILNLEGFEEKKTDCFINGLRENEDLVGFLYGLEYKTYKDTINTNGLGISIAVSNWRPTPAMAVLLDKKGITVKSGVSSKVDYLVYGGDSPAATKGNKAKKLNIPIISYDEFMSKYDI